ncbi:type IV pilin accessory protein, partial [Acinetobacter baumannii]|nr:type IV pilin accessory protein [Acinetobacter baumannii]
VKPLMRNKVQNLNELEKFNSKQQVENILRKYPEANAWVPLKANAVDMVVLMDKNSAQVVKIVDLRPWK